MNLDELTAIDVHTHAEVSKDGHGSLGSERARLQVPPQHPGLRPRRPPREALAVATDKPGVHIGLAPGPS
ncbi:hypothetical protein ABZ917_24635 [Nonomuraea wenchangensis]